MRDRRVRKQQMNYRRRINNSTIKFKTKKTTKKTQELTIEEFRYSAFFLIAKEVNNVWYRSAIVQRSVPIYYLLQQFINVVIQKQSKQAISCQCLEKNPVNHAI